MIFDRSMVKQNKGEAGRPVRRGQLHICVMSAE